MASNLYLDFLIRIQELRNEEQEDGTWKPEAYTILALMMDEIASIIRNSVEMLDEITFLHSLLTYQQLTQDAVSALLQNPNRVYQDELATETDVFVYEIVANLIPQLDLTETQRYTANFFLETIWNSIQIIRPPP